MRALVTRFRIWWALRTARRYSAHECTQVRLRAKGRL